MATVLNPPGRARAIVAVCFVLASCTSANRPETAGMGSTTTVSVESGSSAAAGFTSTSVVSPPLVDAALYASSGERQMIPQLVGLEFDSAWQWAAESGFGPILGNDDVAVDIRVPYRLRIITDDDGIVTSAYTG